MNIRAWTTALAVASAFAASPAGAIEVVTSSPAVQQRAIVTVTRQPDLAALPQGTMLSADELSELPEPEVFAMMLLGLVLIGYRASRDSNEKFK